MTRTQADMHDAHFSPDRRYRYWLEAKLSDRDGLPSQQAGVCLFLMLNPSRADESRSDPTVTRCKGFAGDWGYGVLWVCNLFAMRSPQPEVLKQSPDPVGPMNDGHIVRSARDADSVVCAWGNDGTHLGRGENVLRMLEDDGLSDKMYHFGMTKKGQPRHPLYLKATTAPVRLQSEN